MFAHQNRMGRDSITFWKPQPTSPRRYQGASSVTPVILSLWHNRPQPTGSQASRAPSPDPTERAIPVLVDRKRHGFIHSPGGDANGDDSREALEHAKEIKEERNKELQHPKRGIVAVVDALKPRHDDRQNDT